MRVAPTIHRVFGHFQNLNLLALLEDLRRGHAAQGTWSSGTRLCPVAHGMPAGQRVSELRFLGQAADLGRACDYAARYLGADPLGIYQFVCFWDTDPAAPGWLLRQLEALWEERLADALAVQELLSSGEPTTAGVSGPATRA